MTEVEEKQRFRTLRPLSGDSINHDDGGGFRRRKPFSTQFPLGGCRWPFSAEQSQQERPLPSSPSGQPPDSPSARCPLPLALEGNQGQSQRSRPRKTKFAADGLAVRLHRALSHP